MPKPIIRDIQVKRKPITQPKPVETLARPKMAETIRPRKEEKIEEVLPFIPIEEEVLIRPKKNKPSNSRFKKILFIIILIIAVVGFLIYLITGVNLKITPNILTKNVNEQITLNSWTVPFKSTVMSVSESYAVEVSEEETKKILADKIKNRYKYDTPKNYITIENCETDFYYENTSTENGKATAIKSSKSSLIIEKSGLIDYLNKSMKLNGEQIKDITKLSCELKTDITNYKIGEGAGSLSFLLTGEIKTEKVIIVDDIKNQISGRLKNKAIYDLDQNESILNYQIKLRPFNFFPIIPKNLKHIDVVIESAI